MLKRHNRIQDTIIIIPNNLFIRQPDIAIAIIRTNSIINNIPTEHINPFDDTDTGTNDICDRPWIIKCNSHGIGNLKITSQSTVQKQ